MENTRRSAVERLAGAKYGIGLHWTTQSCAEAGQPNLAFPDAVAAFDVHALASQIGESGAGYILLTVSHAFQHLPFPSAVMDRVLPGRTTRRDLCRELILALAPRGVPVLFYWPSVGTSEDAEWTAASRYAADPAYFAALQYDLVQEIGERYSAALAGWWVDNCYDGPPDYVGWGAGRGSRYDFARYAGALRAGNPERLVAFNFRGTGAWESRTGVGLCDFAAGESDSLDRVPTGPNSGEGGSRWHSFVWMDDFWVHAQPGTPTPRYSDAHVRDYVRYVAALGGFFTYGTAPCQNGRISEPAMAQLRALEQEL